MNHHYHVTISWTGNSGTGTNAYTAYERDHSIKAEGKPVLLGSSDPAFRGDATRYNPEELFLASLSSCHMLWYLHFCAEANIIVMEYRDQAAGTLTVNESGSGHFTEVILKPEVVVANSSMKHKALELHKKAHKFCFIANSCNFPVKHEPLIRVK